MQIWFTNKFINRAQFHIFSHSLQFMGTINTYKKPLSIQLHLLWRIPRLSLVSKLYLNLCFWYLIFSFLLGSDRLIISTLPLWCIQILLFLPFISIYITPPPSLPVSLLSRRYVHFKWIPLNRLSPGKMTVWTKNVMGSSIKPALLRANLQLFLNRWGP